MRFLNCCMVVVLGLASPVIFAKSNAKDPVSIDLQAFQMVTNQKGEQTAKPAKQAKPNDVIEYRAQYTNNTQATVKNLVATLPIPVGTQFLAKSTPAQAQASVDGVKFEAMPLKRKVADKVINVPLGEYRALRWTIAEIPAGKSITVTAQTRVESTTAVSK